MNITGVDPKRGHVWYADYVTPGSNQLPKSRPVVVVSNDACNATARFVTVVPLTTQLTHMLPTHVIVPNSSSTGLKAVSVAKAENVTAVDKTNLDDFIGVIPEDVMEDIEDALLVQLGMAEERSYE